jgi:hydroxymethylglutaryl-CoA lyase
MLPTHVTIVEVGPRDGLQNEVTPVSTAQKIELVRYLQAAGLRHIELTSFVSPKWVPQMADNAQVLQGVRQLFDAGASGVGTFGSGASNMRFSVLTPNLEGFEAAVANPACQPDEVVVFAAATQAFSLRNINCSIEASIERFQPVVQAAHARGIKVRGAVSVALGCPYQGRVTPDEVESVVKQMQDIGVDHCGVADTIGVGNPQQVQQAMERALKHFALHEVSGHFHDTYGLALTNVYACLQMGVHTFDASVAGLGGCPYAKGATGNLATEDLLFLLHSLGLETGVDMPKLIHAVSFISQVLQRKPVSRVGNALQSLLQNALQNQPKLT